MSRNFFVNLVLVIGFLFGFVYGCGVLEKLDENQNLNENIANEQVVQNENLQKQENVVTNQEQTSNEPVLINDILDSGIQQEKAPDFFDSLSTDNDLADLNTNDVILDGSDIQEKDVNKDFAPDVLNQENQQDTNVVDNVVSVGKLKVVPAKIQKNGSNPYFYLAGETGKLLMRYEFTAVDEDIEIQKVTLYFQLLNPMKNNINTLIKPLQFKRNGNNLGKQFFIVSNQTAVYDGGFFVIKKGTTSIIDLVMDIPDSKTLQSSMIIMPGIACISTFDDKCWDKVGT